MPAHAFASAVAAAAAGGHHFGGGFLILIVLVIGALGFSVARLRNRPGAHHRDEEWKVPPRRQEQGRTSRARRPPATRPATG